MLGCLFQAGVGVHFDEPRLESRVYHEVVPEDFKGVLLLPGVQLAGVHALEGHFDDRQNLLLEEVVKVDVDALLLLQ